MLLSPSPTSPRATSWPAHDLTTIRLVLQRRLLKGSSTKLTNYQDISRLYHLYQVNKLAPVINVAGHEVSEMSAAGLFLQFQVPTTRSLRTLQQASHRFTTFLQHLQLFHRHFPKGNRNIIETDQGTHSTSFHIFPNASRGTSGFAHAR